jgi:hypothetical protein
MFDVEDRVAAGIVWLDSQEPDWRERVNIETFNIRQTCDCVLGQVFEDNARSDWASGFDYVVSTGLLSVRERVDFGFDSLLDTEWEPLQAEWTRVLARQPALAGV